MRKNFTFWRFFLVVLIAAVVCSSSLFAASFNATGITISGWASTTNHDPFVGESIGLRTSDSDATFSRVTADTDINFTNGIVSLNTVAGSETETPEHSSAFSETSPDLTDRDGLLAEQLGKTNFGSLPEPLSMDMLPADQAPASATAGSIPFELVYNTTLGTPGNSITLPMRGTGNGTIEWGDGLSEPFSSTGDKVHTYASSGSYTVKITGTLTGFGSTTAVNEKLIRVVSFGDLGLTDLFCAFSNAINLNKVPATLPATVTSTAGMFFGCTTFNQSISGWDMSNVTDMSSMFNGAKAFNQPVGNWNVGNVVNMSYLFYGAETFNQPLSTWGVSQVKDMSSMFYHANSFNQDISNWNVSQVTNMNDMFHDAVSFNKDISSWNVNQVKDMSLMFCHATGFNQDITSWDVSNVASMSGMFELVTLPTASYDKLLIAWAGKTVKTNVPFHGGNSKYSPGTAQAARATLTSGKGWTITDGGMLPQLTAGESSLTTSKVYDGTASATVTVGTVTGINPVDVGKVTVSATATYANANVGTDKTITVVYTLSGPASANYAKPADYVITTGAITAKPLTISGVTAANKVYDGGATAVLSGGTLNDVVGSEVVTITSGTGTFADKNAGTGIIVTATGFSLAGTDAGNYILFAQPSGLTANITSAMLIVTADAKTKVYGEANPLLTFTYSGWKNGEETIDTPPTISTTVNATTAAGTYPGAITLSGGLDNNYSFTFGMGNLQVTKATLTVTPDAKTKMYGAANPELTFTYLGWVNGVETIDTPPTISTSVNATTIVGVNVCGITISGGFDNNYDFIYGPGGFSVTKAILTVTANAQTKVYGAANPSLTFTYSGWKNGDNESVLNIKPTAINMLDATATSGTYSGAITLAGGYDNNYDFTYVPAKLEVTKAILTVTANAQTKEYGAVNPILTYTYSGWKNGEEAIETPPTISTIVNVTTAAGIYPGAITLAGGSDNNYDFSYVPARFEVTKATLTVMANAQTKVHGSVNPTLCFTYRGWKNGEETIDTPPSIATTVDAATTPGTYPGSITIGGGSDNNYMFDYVAANFEVTATKIAGDTNGDGKINDKEVAGDKNGNGIIDGKEVSGDQDGNGIIDGKEVAGDKDGNGTINDKEVTGDKDGNGIIDSSEVLGDTNGDGKKDVTNIAGDTNGDGKITSTEIVGDKDGNGKIDGSEVTGDKDGNGKIDGSEIVGDANGNGTIDGNETTQWPTGIDNQENNSALSAYAVGNTEIRLKGLVSGAAVATLYDLQGKAIVVVNLEEGILNIIPTPNIRTGVYLLMVKDQERIQSFKIPVSE